VSDFKRITYGRLEDVAAEHGLTGSETGVYRWARDAADRHTGEIYGTAEDFASESRYHRETVASALRKLEAEGLAKVELRRGHPGKVTLLEIGQLWPTDDDGHKSKNRGRSAGFRGRSAGNRDRSAGSRQATRENTPQKKKRLLGDDAAPSGEASSSPTQRRRDTSLNGLQPEQLEGPPALEEVNARGLTGAREALEGAAQTRRERPR
jgi:hypothetical protein